MVFKEFDEFQAEEAAVWFAEMSRDARCPTIKINRSNRSPVFMLHLNFHVYLASRSWRHIRDFGDALIEHTSYASGKSNDYNLIFHIASDLLRRHTNPPEEWDLLGIQMRH